MKKLFLLLSVLFVVSCSKDPIIYTLTTSANPSEGGTVNPITKQYEEGSTATITATPAAEYVFQSWSGATGLSSSTSLVMSSDKSVTANFIKKKYALTTTVEGEGTVNEKVIKAGAATDYNSGTIVELTATPSDEWLFVEWTGDVTGTENPTQITIDKAKSVTAVFVKKQYSLTIEIKGEGAVGKKIIKTGMSTDYNSGTIIELNADTANYPGWEFKEWRGDLTGVENPKQITIDKAKTVTAVFKNDNISPFYYDENGITIKARDWIDAGTTEQLNGITYTAVDNTTLKEMVVNGEDVTKVVTTLVNDITLGDFTIFHDGYSKGFNQDIGSWDVTNLTNMNNMFANAKSFNQDISNWDVSNVTNMSGMFLNAHKFNQNLNNWVVSSVRFMSYMFAGAIKFNQNIVDWDVGNVIGMVGMFNSTPLFNQDISNWDVSNVTNMSAMFSGARKFNQDIGDWDVSKVTQMGRMFGYSYDFNQDIGSWDVSKVIGMTAMFDSAVVFNQDIGSWDLSNVTGTNAMFKNAESFNQDIGGWDVSNVNVMFSMFEEAKTFNQDLTKWCVTNFTTEPGDFSKESALTEANTPKWGTCPD